MNAKTDDNKMLKTPNPKSRRYTRWLVTGIVISFAIIAAGGLAAYYLGEFAKKDLIKDSEAVLETATIHLSAETDKVEGAVKAFSYSPLIVPALISRNARDIENASRALDRYNKTLKLSVTYLLNADGMTIASSNRKEPDSFIGKSYKFRPYFSQAIRGQAATYFARGVTSNARGFYASAPVFHDGKTIGVVVIKQDIDDIGTYIRKLKNCFFISKEGIIFLASRPEMLFKSMWPLDEKTQKRLSTSRQFGDGPFAALFPKEFSVGKHLSFEGDTCLLLRKTFNAEGWSIVLLAPTKIAFMYRAFGVIITLLILIIFLSLFIFLYLKDKSLQREIKIKDDLRLLSDDLKDQRDLLETSEERYRNLFENAGEAILVAQDFMFKFANPKAEELLGWPKEVISARPIGDFIHPDDRQMVLERHGSRLKGEDPAREYSFRVIDRNGNSKWVELIVARFSWEEKPATLCFMTDITERKQAQEKLRDSETRYRTLFEASADGILIADIETKAFMYANPAMSRMLGYTEDELRTLGLADIHPSEDLQRIVAEFTTLARGEKTSSRDIPCLRKDGTILYADINTAYITLNSRLYLMGIFHDVTVRKKAAEELALNLEIQAAMNALLGLSLEGGTIKEFLDRSLDLILSLQWLAIESKGAIFLTDAAGETLHLQSHNGLAKELCAMCKMVPFGHCLCGRAAALRAVVFADRVDERHDIHYEGMLPHGHYCVPILSGDHSLGVIVLYVKEGYTRRPWEEDSLKAIANLLAGTIERKQAEEFLLKTLKDLQEAKEHFEVIFNTSPDAAQITRLRDGMIVNVNDGFTALSGFTRTEALGKTSIEINVWKNAADRQKLITELVNKGFCENLEAPFQIKDGSQRMGSVSAKIISLQGEPHMLSVIRDITEHIREEEALKQSEVRYRSLFDSAHDAIILMDRNIVIDCNARAAELLRCPKEKMIGNTTTRFWPERQADGRLSSEVAIEHIKKALKNERSSNEVRHLRADGTLVDTDVTLNYFEMKGKKYLQAIIRDITERKQAEEKLLITSKELQDAKDMLVRTEKMAAIGKLSFGVAHEILNPLNIISLRLQMLEMLEEPTNNVREFIGISKKQIERIVKITQGMNDFSQMRVEMIPENLNRIVERSLAICQPQMKIENIQVTTSLFRDIPDIKMDRTQIMRVVVNIINNAIDAMRGREEKILTITTALSKEKTGAAWARLTIADNGNGISEENLTKIFDLFFTTKDPDKGTGMGLSIAYSIITEHGGHITAANNDSGGASLIIDLPVEVAG